MIRLLIILIVLVGGFIIGPMIAGHQGVAFFQVVGYRVKMSFNTFIVLQLLFLALLYICYKIFKKIYYSKSTLGGWLRSRSPKKALKNIEQAQLFMLEGNYQKAGKLLSKSAKSASNSTLTYLQAAQAHIQSNQLIEARKHLEQAAAICQPKELFAFKLIQTRLQVKAKEYAAAQVTVEKMLQEKPRNPEVLRLADQIYYETENYQAIIDTLPAMYKAEVYPESQLDQFKSIAYIKRMKQLVEQGGIDTLTKWYKEQPRAIRNNPTYQQTLEYYRNGEQQLLSAHDD